MKNKKFQVSGDKLNKDSCKLQDASRCNPNGRPVSGFKLKIKKAIFYMSFF